MKLILQRVSHAKVDVAGSHSRAIGQGLVVLVGITQEDTQKEAQFLAEKAVNLRIFDDEDGNLNRSLLDIEGDCLIVSNFTLYGNCKKGRRPSFVAAARPEQAVPLYKAFVEAVRSRCTGKVETGEFGGDMQVEIHNDGPVTLVLESQELMPRL